MASNATLGRRRLTAEDRSPTTTAAVVISCLLSLVGVAGAVILWVEPSWLEEAAPYVGPAGGWIGIDTAVANAAVVSVVFFLVGVAWWVFAGLLRHGTSAGWVGLCGLAVVNAFSNLTAGGFVTRVDFWLAVALVALLVFPTTRLDCGIMSYASRIERERRHLVRLQEQLRAAEEQPVQLAEDAYAPPPGAVSPHPRAYWDPSLTCWVRWDPTDQTFLRHDPVSHAWQRMG